MKIVMKTLIDRLCTQYNYLLPVMKRHPLNASELIGCFLCTTYCIVSIFSVIFIKYSVSVDFQELCPQFLFKTTGLRQDINIPMCFLAIFRDLELNFT